MVDGVIGSALSVRCVGSKDDLGMAIPLLQEGIDEIARSVTRVHCRCSKVESNARYPWRVVLRSPATLEAEGQDSTGRTGLDKVFE